MSSKKKAQHDKIYEYLLTHDDITSWEAIIKFRITRLAAVIYKLRKKGIPICSERIYHKNEDGTIDKYSKYWLEENDS